MPEERGPQKKNRTGAYPLEVKVSQEYSIRGEHNETIRQNRVSSRVKVLCLEMLKDSNEGRVL